MALIILSTLRDVLGPPIEAVVLPDTCSCHMVGQGSVFGIDVVGQQGVDAMAVGRHLDNNRHGTVRRFCRRAANYHNDIKADALALILQYELGTV